MAQGLAHAMANNFVTDVDLAAGLAGQLDFNPFAA